VLEVYNRVGAGVHLLTGEVYLLAVVVSLVLGLAEVAVCNLQLTVPVRRWKCTTTEVVFLMPQPVGVLPICDQPQTLLDDGPGGVVLQVKQVLRILGRNLGRPYLSEQVRNLVKFHHDLPRNFEYETCC
jgi:hypothetical protein